MINKRGQAAMEFLMTYGWALLVVLVAIGALAFFGVLNPGQFLPSTCTITPGIACNDFKVAEGGTPITGTVDLRLQNGFGDSLTTVTVDIDIGQDGANDCPQYTNAAWADGAELSVAMTGCTVGPSGGKAKADVIVGYTGSGGISHVKTGVLVTQIE